MFEIRPSPRETAQLAGTESQDDVGDGFISGVGTGVGIALGLGLVGIIGILLQEKTRR